MTFLQFKTWHFYIETRPGHEPHIIAIYLWYTSDSFNPAIIQPNPGNPSNDKCLAFHRNSRGPFQYFYHNLNLMENWLSCNSTVGNDTTTTFCTCHTQHSCHAMCKILKWLLYCKLDDSRMKFPSKLNYDGKFVHEMGPGWCVGNNHQHQLEASVKDDKTSIAHLL